LLVCSSSPLGLGNRQLPDENFNASSSVNPYKPSDARLRTNTSWVSEGAYEFLQISFQPYSKLVTGVATQGNPHHYWFVTRYNLLHSLDGVTWSYYEHEGQPGSRKVKVSVISRNVYMVTDGVQYQRKSIFARLLSKIFLLRDKLRAGLPLIASLMFESGAKAPRK